MDKTGKKSSPRRSGRIAFIACRDDIRAEIERGATMIAVYDLFAPRLGFSYVQFTRYVNADIHGKPPKPRGTLKAPATERGWTDTAAGSWPPERHGSTPAPSSPGAEKPTPSGPRTLGPRKLPEFHYDPMDALRHRKRQR